jgi:bifunctional DNase/RNase
MEIPAELSRTIINEEIDQQIVVLREKGAPQRSFPIVIGMGEILAIDRRMKGIAMPRPLTHDLVGQIIAKLGGAIKKVVICDLRDHTFFSTIHIQRNGEMIEVDSRPSDALALSAGLNVPLFVEDHVFEQLSL